MHTQREDKRRGKREENKNKNKRESFFNSLLSLSVFVLSWFAMIEMAFLPPTPSSDHHHHHHHYFFQSHQPHHQQQQLDHEDTNLTILSNSCPPHHDFHGGHVLPTLTMMRSPVMSGCGGGEYQGHGGEEHDDLSDDGSHLVGLGEKKKRLSLEQVKTLEKNFEMGTKLDPERKVQVAKALGLQPRQVAIWFQNRRARWKTKQLEKDYNLLKRQFDALKANNDSLLSHNKKLHTQLLALKSGATNATNTQEGGTEFGSINLNATTKSYCWSNNGSEISSDINLGISTTQPEEIPSSNNLQFPSSFLPTSLTNLLTSSSSAPKPSDHPHQQIHQDDTFGSMFSGGTSGGAAGGGGGGVGEQPHFWAWPPDQHHLH